MTALFQLPLFSSPGGGCKGAVWVLCNLYLLLCVIFACKSRSCPRSQQLLSRYVSVNVNARASQQRPFLGTRRPLKKTTPENWLIPINKRKHFEDIFLKNRKPLALIHFSSSLLLENKDKFWWRNHLTTQKQVESQKEIHVSPEMSMLFCPSPHEAMQLIFQDLDSGERWLKTLNPTSQWSSWKGQRLDHLSLMTVFKNFLPPAPHHLQDKAQMSYLAWRSASRVVYISSPLPYSVSSELWTNCFLHLCPFLHFPSLTRLAGLHSVRSSLTLPGKTRLATSALLVFHGIPHLHHGCTVKATLLPWTENSWRESNFAFLSFISLLPASSP